VRTPFGKPLLESPAVSQFQINNRDSAEESKLAHIVEMLPPFLQLHAAVF